MNNHSVKELKVIEALEPQVGLGDNILDEPIPEIAIPILKSTQISNPPTQITKPIKKEIDKFADWILSYVPKPIKKRANKRVDDLKEKVNQNI